VLGVLLGRNLEEDSAGVFSEHVLELLMATCAPHVVVGLAGSGFNYLDGGEFTVVAVTFSLSYTLSGELLGSPSFSTCSVVPWLSKILCSTLSFVAPYLA
jgi:hypothetical protein